MSVPINFVIPAQWKAAYTMGEVVRYGALLKDSNTGQIVAHLQETGLLQNGLDIASGLANATPLNAVTSVIGVFQNHQIGKRLEQIQSAMVGLHTLSIANLAVTGLGIGVTVASTVVTLRRLDKLSKQVEDGFSEVTEARRRDEVDSWRANVRSELQELDELRVRSDVRHAAEQVARGARRLSDEMIERLRRSSDDETLNSGTATELITFLAALGGAQVRALCWLDEAAAAQHRATTIAQNFEEISLVLPADRLQGPAEFGSRVQALLGEVRALAASQPMLLETLQAKQISTRGYLSEVDAEENEPLLILPSAKFQLV
ncbi:hypothetical protein [Aestuariicoccus sp. MJ-SS9]|uniref:hypothetical protein n=1 Tax=Aestuariicoccus sp. MJ-SS9 TaxID=3079855 RepID=UPI0029069552|nr:hypothetical protein [Aestuariicoccus sp. MJ-SS9]MDU8912490.1 hypothetical protein [Aestuariicoccus sp. MJ-SS9]